uniref:Secretagogin, EF-hand calcium binding protein n=1 Tax=Maylandia zebra TaxID=106582 RepID=A0A3P9DJ78_9CICH
MDSAFEDLDAAGFLEIWQHFDADDNGYIEGKELDDFFRHMMKRMRPQDKVTEEDVQNLKKRFMSAYDVTADGKLQIQELAHMILPEDENFLLVFRRENPLDNTVEFMTVRSKITHESRAFLKDLFELQHKEVTPDKLEDYTDAMMKIFDKNKDGRLDLNDLARYAPLFLPLYFPTTSFLFLVQSETGALEGPEVDGFVKDMMGLVRPNITGPELDKLRAVLLRHCDVNKDGKIQRNELALCLGVKLKN